MIGPELQGAMVAALKAGTPIAAGRVYDNPPASPVFPYITVGDEQILDDGNTCDDGWEVFADVYVWSRPATRSKAEVKALAAAAVDRLRVTTLAVTGFRVVIAALDSSRVFRDPDDITEHAVLTLRYVLQPA